MEWRIVKLTTYSGEKHRKTEYALETKWWFWWTYLHYRGNYKIHTFKTYEEAFDYAVDLDLRTEKKTKEVVYIKK